ncbi:MAG TPA: MFS transporter [Limnochordia bacterium]|nr:MFS transporter [Limnochordia bacterium]
MSLANFALLGYFLIGTVVIIFPPLLPDIVDSFHLSLALAGLIFPGKSIGGLIAGLWAGVWSDRVGRKPLVVGSAALLGASLGLAAIAGQWWLFVTAFVVMGAAQGAFSTVINALAAELGGERRGRALNRLHGVYGAGAALAPLIIAALTLSGLGWRTVLGLAGVIWFAFAAFSATFQYPAAQVAAKRTALNWSLFRNAVFLLLFAAAFIYNGVAWSLLGWMGAYLQQGAQLPAVVASGMISLFYAALTIGRFSCAAASERIGYAKTLLFLAGGTTLCYPAVVFGGLPWLVAAGVFFSGLFLSGLYPTALAIATRRFPAFAGTVVGTLSIAMTAGGMAPPWWTGLIADHSSFQWAVGLNYLMVVPLIWIALRLAAHERATPAQGESTTPV